MSPAFCKLSGLFDFENNLNILMHKFKLNNIFCRIKFDTCFL